MNITYVCVYIYIYIYREIDIQIDRERERDIMCVQQHTCMRYVICVVVCAKQMSHKCVLVSQLKSLSLLNNNIYIYIYIYIHMYIHTYEHVSVMFVLFMSCAVSYILLCIYTYIIYSYIYIYTQRERDLQRERERFGPCCSWWSSGTPRIITFIRLIIHIVILTQLHTSSTNSNN